MLEKLEAMLCRDCANSNAGIPEDRLEGGRCRESAPVKVESVFPTKVHAFVLHAIASL